MLHDFTYYNPTKIYFGKDAMNNLPSELNNYGKNILLLYGKNSIKKIGLYDEVVKVLKDCGKNVVELAGIKPRISNYFLRFSAEYKRFHKLSSIPNDWYEYVEYGTTNPLTIFLQRNGFSREAATYIKKHPEYIEQIDSEYKVKSSILNCQSRLVCKEAAEIRYNIPELFS